MSDHQERRNTCPSRLLTGDGRVLACDHQHSDDRMWEERDDPRAVMHYVCWPASSIVKHSWPDDDPCAWDAACAWCDQGHVPGYDIDRNPTDEPCPACSSSGMDESIPEQIVRALWLAAHRIAGPTHRPEFQAAPKQPEGDAS